MNFLLNFDIFGVQPNFYILNNFKYQSILGVILSILCLFIVLLFSFLFGKDFYFRTTPRVVMEEKTSIDYRNVTLLPDDFIFAFRIEDIDGNPYNTDLLRLSMYYAQYVSNASGYYLINNDTDIIVNCNSIPGMNKTAFAKTKTISDWNCLNYNKHLLLGGSWSSDFINFFQFQVNNNMSIVNGLSKLQDLLYSNEYYISIYYQQSVFSPNNIDNPLSLRYKNYFYRLLPESDKRDRLFFRSYFLQDDLGWIFTTDNSTNVTALYSLQSDFYTNQIEYKSNIQYEFYSFVLYYDSDSFLYHRNFMKIQELAALVGGFLKIILVVFQFVMFYYNYFKMKLALVKLFYDNDDHVGIRRSIKIANDMFSPNKQMQVPKNSIESTNKREKTLRRLNSPVEITKTNGEDKRGTQVIIEDHNIHEEASKKLVKKYNVTFIKLLLRSLCYKNDQFVRKFIEEEKVLDNKMDIAFYLNLTNQFFYLKKMILSEPQIYALDVISKNGIAKKRESQAKREKKEMKKLKCYLDEMKQDNNISKIDKVIIEEINFDMKDEQEVNNIKKF